MSSDFDAVALHDRANAVRPWDAVPAVVWRARSFLEVSVPHLVVVFVTLGYSA